VESCQPAPANADWTRGRRNRARAALTPSPGVPLADEWRSKPPAGP
jgi:hypothetical protein